MAMPLRKYTALQQDAESHQGILEGFQQLIEDNVKKKRLQMPSIEKDTHMKFSKTLTSNRIRNAMPRQSISDLSYTGLKSKPKIITLLEKISQPQTDFTRKIENNSSYLSTSEHRTNINNKKSSHSHSDEHPAQLQKILSLLLQRNTQRFRRELTRTEFKTPKNIESPQQKQKYSTKPSELAQRQVLPQKPVKARRPSSGSISLREDFKETPVSNLLPVALPLVAVGEVSVNVTSKNESETIRLWEASYYHDLVQRYRYLNFNII